MGGRTRIVVDYSTQLSQLAVLWEIGMTSDVLTLKKPRIFVVALSTTKSLSQSSLMASPHDLCLVSTLKDPYKPLEKVTSLSFPVGRLNSKVSYYNYHRINNGPC